MIQDQHSDYTLVEGMHAICFFVICVTFSYTAFSEEEPPGNDTLIVRYASTKFELFSHRDNYLEELINLALVKSGIPFDLVPVDLNPLTENRSIHYLQSGAYTIHWLNTSKQLEDKLLPIRVPLFKGLIGWRLMLIRESDANLFKNIKTLEQLTKFTLLQGYDWPDTRLLKDNGFQLVTSTDFNTLPRMLVRNRGDAFPRSVLEIWDELDFYDNMDIVVEENLVLSYPAAYYFFVNPENTALKDAMEKGLNSSITDGSFNTLFMKYFGKAIRRTNLNKRTIINLHNPNMSGKTPFHRKELWFSTK